MYILLVRLLIHSASYSLLFVFNLLFLINVRSIVPYLCINVLNILNLNNNLYTLISSKF